MTRLVCISVVAESNPEILNEAIISKYSPPLSYNYLCTFCIFVFSQRATFLSENTYLCSGWMAFCSARDNT